MNFQKLLSHRLESVGLRCPLRRPLLLGSLCIACFVLLPLLLRLGLRCGHRQSLHLHLGLRRDALAQERVVHAPALLRRRAPPRRLLVLPLDLRLSHICESRHIPVRGGLPFVPDICLRPLNAGAHRALTRQHAKYWDGDLDGGNGYRDAHGFAKPFRCKACSMRPVVLRLNLPCYGPPMLQLGTLRG